MAENRLFQMVYLLMEKGSLTAPQLAKHFEVSVRTIYRDIDILSGAGIPVYTSQGKGGGIFIQKSFVLNRALLSEKEQLHLIMALEGIRIADAQQTGTLVSKIRSLFQKYEPGWIEVDFSDWARAEDKVTVFDRLKAAILQNKSVSFIYFSGKREAVRRVVEPLKLVFKSRAWFVYGYCLLREDYRLFKLTRIRALEIMEKRAYRPVPSQIFKQPETYNPEVVALTLKFDRDVLYRVFDEFPSHVIEETGDGVLVKIALPYNEGLLSFIISFGDKAEILEPLALRDELLIYCEKIQGKYKT